jgi:hypothetical protein
MEFESEQPGLGAAEFKEVVDELAEPVGLDSEGAVVAGDCGGVASDAVLECLGEGSDPGKGSA